MVPSWRGDQASIPSLMITFRGDPIIKSIDTPWPVRVASGTASKARGFLDQRVTLNRCVSIFDSTKN